MAGDPIQRAIRRGWIDLLRQAVDLSVIRPARVCFKEWGDGLPEVSCGDSQACPGPARLLMMPAHALPPGSYRGHLIFPLERKVLRVRTTVVA